MAFTDRYANFDLATGANNGTSEADAWQTPAAVIAGVAAGHRVNIKRQATAYNLTTSVDFNVAGTVTAPIYYRAYDATPGDGGIWEVAYNSGATASLSFSGASNFVEGVWFKPGAAVNANLFQVSGAGSWAIRCRGDLRGACAFANLFRCYFTQAVGGARISAAGTNSANVIWRDTFFQRVGGTGSATGFTGNDTFGRAHTVHNCVFAGNGAAGEPGYFLDRANDTRGVQFNNCRFYNFADGIEIDEEPNAFTELVVISRCLFDTMAGYAVLRNNVEVGLVRLADNYYRACTSGFTNYSDEAQVVPATALTADPFVDASNGDFRMNETAGGGAVLRAAVESMDPAGSAMNLYPFASWHAPAASGGGSRAVIIGG